MLTSSHYIVHAIVASVHPTNLVGKKKTFIFILIKFMTTPARYAKDPVSMEFVMQIQDSTLSDLATIFVPGKQELHVNRTYKNLYRTNITSSGKIKTVMMMVTKALRMMPPKNAGCDEHTPTDSHFKEQAEMPKRRKMYNNKS